jgi:hypothetical protein
MVLASLENVSNFPAGPPPGQNISAEPGGTDGHCRPGAGTIILRQKGKNLL